MRVNALYFSPKFQSFLNTSSFVLMIMCFLLTILLPLPYMGEQPGGISLQPNPELAPPIIAICVMIPFLIGVIFYLIFKITYQKSIQEVKSEFQENVSFNLIDTKTIFDWENQLEEFSASKVLRKTELEKKKYEQFLKVQKIKEKMDKELLELEKLKNENNRTNQTTKEKTTI